MPRPEPRKGHAAIAYHLGPWLVTLVIAAAMILPWGLVR